MKNETTGDKIRKMRKLNGMTLEQLANRLGVSASAVSQYERGAIKPPYTTLIKIASLFSCPVRDIVSVGEWDAINDAIDSISNAISETDISQMRCGMRLTTKELNTMFYDEAAPKFCYLHKAMASKADDGKVYVYYSDMHAKVIGAEYNDIYNLCTSYTALNDEGRAKAIDFMKDLLDIPRYLRDAET